MFLNNKRPNYKLWLSKTENSTLLTLYSVVVCLARTKKGNKEFPPNKLQLICTRKVLGRLINKVKNKIMIITDNSKVNINLLNENDLLKEQLKKLKLENTELKEKFSLYAVKESIAKVLNLLTTPVVVRSASECYTCDNCVRVRNNKKCIVCKSE